MCNGVGKGDNDTIHIDEDTQSVSSVSKFYSSNKIDLSSSKHLNKDEAKQPHSRK